MDIKAAVPALRAIKNVVVDEYATQQELFFSIRKSLTARYFDLYVYMTGVSNQMSWWENKIREKSSAQISLGFDHDRYTWWP